MRVIDDHSSPIVLTGDNWRLRLGTVGGQHLKPLSLSPYIYLFWIRLYFSV